MIFRKVKGKDRCMYSGQVRKDLRGSATKVFEWNAFSRRSEE